MTLAKKGVFLTFIALSLVAAMLVLIKPNNSVQDNNFPVVQNRIMQANSFVTDVENVYLKNALESSGTKAVFALIEYMNDTDSFLTNFDRQFVDVMRNGTINGSYIDTLTNAEIMKDNTLEHALSVLQNVSQDDFTTNSLLNITGLSAYQQDPWNLKVRANATLFVQTESASWQRNMTVIALIPIQRFADPYPFVNSNAQIFNIINKSMVKSASWNVTSFEEHMALGTYIQNPAAPNFIMRFMNQSSSSQCCGIESIINPPLLSDNDETESYADYLFYSRAYENNCAQLYNMTEFYPDYSKLKLDYGHILLYNLTGASFEDAC